MTSARLIVGLSILSLCVGGFALLLSVGPASAVIPPFVSVNSLEGLVTVGGSSPISVSTVGQAITVSCSTCATGSGFVTSLDSLTGALTLAHFSSLNMTTVGNTITLGINLANYNVWTATQEVNGGNLFVDNGFIGVYNNIADTHSTIDLFNSTIGFGVGGSTPQDAFIARTGVASISLPGTITNANIWTALQTFDSGISINSGASITENTVYGAGNDGIIVQPVSNDNLRTDFYPAGTGTQNSFRLLDTSSPFASGNAFEFFTWGGGGYSSIDSSGINGGSNLPFWLSIGGSKLIELNAAYTVSFFGGSGSTPVFGTSTTGIANTQGFQSFTCNQSLLGVSPYVCTFPITEPNTAYYAVCVSASNIATVNYVANTSTTTITIGYAGAGGIVASCIVTHQ